MTVDAVEFMSDCAELTGGFSGADLAGLVDAAKLKAMHQAGVLDHAEVTMQSEDLFHVLDMELKQRGQERHRGILSKAYSKYRE